jgi:hypothetical protein
MKRPIQVYFDAPELAQLEAWSRSRGWTKSQAIRAAVRALTRAPGGDALRSLSGMIEGLPPDLSAHFDTHLDGTFVAERTPPYGTRPSRSRARVRR